MYWIKAVPVPVCQCVWMCVRQRPCDCALVWTWFVVAAMVLVLWIVFIINEAPAAAPAAVVDVETAKMTETKEYNRCLYLVFSTFTFIHSVSVIHCHHAGWHNWLCQITLTHTQTYAHKYGVGFNVYNFASRLSCIRTSWTHAHIPMFIRILSQLYVCVCSVVHAFCLLCWAMALTAAHSSMTM